MTPEQAFMLVDKYLTPGAKRAELALELMTLANPLPVSDEPGPLEQFLFDQVPFQVVARVVGADLEPTADCPGESRAVEVESVYLFGYRLPGEIANAVVEHYREQLDEFYIEAEAPDWALDQSEGAA